MLKPLLFELIFSVKGSQCFLHHLASFILLLQEILHVFIKPKPKFALDAFFKLEPRLLNGAIAFPSPFAYECPKINGILWLNPLEDIASYIPVGPESAG